MSTIITAAYVAPSATNLTQSVIRDGTLTQAITPISFTTQGNYTKSYTASFEIVSSNPSTITLSTTAPNMALTRVSNTYSCSSQYTSGSVVINNWAYFKQMLRNITITTDTSVWPNPAFTINASITDGTTTLSGVISVDELTSSTPTTPVLTATRISRIQTDLSWTASTQTLGPGVSGYNIYKDGVLYATTASTSYSDVIGTGDTYNTHDYKIQAYDGSSPTPILSAFSNTVSIAGVERFIIKLGTTYAYSNPNAATYLGRQDLGGTSRSFPGMCFGKIVSFKNTVSGSPPSETNVTLGYSSLTGTNDFSSLTLPSFPETYDPTFSYEGASGNNMYLTASDTAWTQVLKTTDGTTWTKQTLPESCDPRTLVFSSGQFRILNFAGDKVLSSSDGVTWTSNTLPESGFYSIDYYGSYFIIGKGTKFLYTTNLTSFTTFTPAANTYQISGAGDTWFLLPSVTESTTGYYSTNGSSWTSMTIPLGVYGKGVKIGSNYLIPMKRTSNNTSAVYSSTDFSTWTSMLSGTANQWNGNGLAINRLGTIVVYVPGDASGVVYSAPSNLSSWTTNTWTGGLSTTSVTKVYFM